MSAAITEVPDSHTLFKDTEFIKSNQEVADQWVSLRDLYPGGVDEPLLPAKMSREQFAQGNHFECFMLSALATLVRFPDVIRKCFVTQKVRNDGRYTFQFFRGQQWVKVEIDDTIALEDDDVLYMQSPTEHWWPLLLEKAYAKFYKSYEQLEGCTLLETFHDLTGHPVQNIPMTAKLAKSAGVDLTDGQYWLSMGESLQRGDYVASALSKAADLEAIGMQSEQQYAILEIFSLTGSSTLDDIVVHLHNPFEDEEFEYNGPLNKNDPKWTAKQRKQHPVDDRHSIFMPLNSFIKIANSIQFCFMHTVEDDAQFFSSAWKGPSAGGNPTYSTWRKNPAFILRNDSPVPVKTVVMIQQDDQRRDADVEVGSSYRQCGLVVVRPSYPNPIPTFWITGNNHKNIFKSLFLNSREVANVVTIPANSMCFMLPSTLQPSLEASFRLAVYRFKKENYSRFSVEELKVPGVDWANPATENVQLREKEKERVDFYVDEGTDIHVLLHQEKPYVNNTGGDAMTQDYMGMYLYDDTDRRIGGVHAATNFREISVIQRAPRSGRYAISLTCPRAKGEVPAYVTVVASHGANVRIVDAPADAGMFDDEDEIDEGNEETAENPVDFTPIQLPHNEVAAAVDSDSPYEERRFYVDNRDVTSEPWVHIGDLYPEGKTKPLLPDDMNSEQFGQGEHYNCSVMTALAGLLDRHPSVIQNCFISKKPRRDGRYTFQFHRYGQWVKVEIDDRIPMIKGDTVFCRSPTHHWWPLLLEKAYAKFYTLYQNLENISQEEVFHDFTGQPCLTVSTDPAAAKVNMSYFDEAPYWLNLADTLPDCYMTAQAVGTDVEAYGLLDDQYYAILDIIPLTDDAQVSDILVKMFNPFEDSPYCGPMNPEDGSWTAELSQALQPYANKRVFYIPANHFAKVFANVQMGYVKSLADPSWHFNSDWTEGTNGGNTSLISWRENPLYVFQNHSSEPVQVVAMVRQPDQRHLLHTLDNQELNYPPKGVTVALANPNAKDIPTHLVTLDNHRLVHALPLVSQREVTNVLTFPSQSLCYVVGHLDGVEHSKFLLSYWFTAAHDTGKLQVARYKPSVAKHAPALAHIVLHNRGKERVDFLVDTPTDVHAVLRQEKPFDAPQGGDFIAEDYLGVYLYDLQNQRIKGTQSAMNYRELSLVTHLDKPGHYVFFCTCPRGSGEVPCKVEICAVEEAHVRITDAPENTKELEELDMAFLDECPEGIPLAELDLNSDRQFQNDLAALQRLLSDPSASEEEIQRLKDRLNARARELAMARLSKDRPIYLPDRDLETLNPFLDENGAYMAVEKERYELKQDPRNEYKIPVIEERLRALADAVASEALSSNIDFVEARPEGIPREELALVSDSTFSDLLKQRARLLRNADENPEALAEIEAALNERARELARAMHDSERDYLDSDPEGVPLALLPLNADDAFCSMEDELREVLRTPPVDPQAVRNLQAQLNERAHELARGLKHGERANFLDPEMSAVSSAVLDKDPDFTASEVQRLQLLHDDPHGSASAIRSLEEALNRRAAELAEAQKANERAFLVPHGVDVDVLRDALDGDADFLRKEAELRELRKDPRKNAAAIKALEKEMVRRGLDLDAQFKAHERPGYLQAEYEGHPLATLPLDDDNAFSNAEAAYLKARASGVATPDELQKLLDIMEERAAAIARELNADDRSKYLPQAVRGIPVKSLGLDDDDEFCRLEQERARAVADPSRAAEVAELEEQLRARADELAHRLLSDDRGYLHPKPAGVPLSLVPLDADDEFCSKESERARLKATTSPNATALAHLEADLNQRAAVVAQRLKEDERSQVLEQAYEGIPTKELPLDSDKTFADLEVERLQLHKEDAAANARELERLEDAMRRRAHELAAAKKTNERGFLGVTDTSLSAEELQRLLDGDARFAELEGRLRELRKNPKENAAAIKALEDEMRRLARAIAEKWLAEERQKYLLPEYEGRLTETIPLNDDKAFCTAEAAYLKARDTGTASASELQQLLDAVHERAAAVAHAMNANDRAAFLPKAVRGIPVKSLGLDDDDEFCRLEQERARAVADPSRAAEVAELEKQMRARADQLAHERLSDDRAFLDRDPEGIPLECVRVDDSEQFRAKEEQRAALLASDKAEASRGAIAALEESMNQQAHDLAKALKHAEVDECVPKKLRGIPRELLPLMDDTEATRIMATRAMSQTATDSAKQAGALKARAKELAAGLIDDVRSHLVPAPLQIPLAKLPLDDDEAFKALEVEAIGELRKPKPEATVLQELIADLDKRAYEMAKQQCWKERETFLKPNPEGRPLASLPLDTDQAFMAAELKRRAAAEAASPDAELLRSLEEQMNARARELAREANRQDRPSYMSSAVRGVAHHALPLDDDDEFCALESRRAAALQDPKQKATVKETEDALRSRALAVAESYLKNDRNFLDARPEGVPLRQVPVDADRAFAQLEEQRAQLRSTEATGQAAQAAAAQVKTIEAQMNARAHELAKEAKARLRGKLEQNALGIPQEALPLDSDAAFNKLEEQMRDAEASHDGEAVAALTEELNQRAEELAEEMHERERAPLKQDPEGMPLRSLPLNSDAEFLALEGMVRGLAAQTAAVAGQRPRNSDAAKLAALHDHLNLRASELAYEARKAYCDAAPEGIPLESLGLAGESDFLAEEEEHRKLLQSHQPDSEAVRASSAALNDMAHAIARSRLEGDRGYLDVDPEGVSLAVLALSSDPKFHALEVERALLKAQRSTTAAPKIKALEEKLNDRAHELARAQKEEDLEGLEAAPFGVPLAVLHPHTDPKFAAMVDELRELKKDPAANKSAIAELQAKMNEQCRAMAKARVEDDRGFLDQNPNGVPLSLLPLEKDAAFQQLEAKRANLRALDPRRNAAAIQELEGKLTERVHELANERIAKELEGIDPTPFGVPLKILRPYQDPEFKELIAQLRALSTLDSHDPHVAQIKAAMEQRCQTMAHDLLEKDRGYLHKNPKEVPLSVLPLNADEAFHSAEVRRAVLKAENPRGNADKITELENQLNLRALELAEQRRAADLKGLDSDPEGVPLAVVNPHSDAQFAKLVDQRRALEVKVDDAAAAASAKSKLPALIEAMNNRAHEIARSMLQDDRDYLDGYPEGVALAELPIDTDGAFREMEVQRTTLKTENSKRNAGRIKDLETRLNDRAHELARLQKAADLKGINPAPRGVPLELLRPHEDARFAEQVQTLRQLKRNPPRDVDEVPQHVAEMNARADELARKVMDRGYLDPAPDKVALEFLPLDDDEKFRALEVERAKLKLTDPRRQADKIAALEGELNERALELAKRQRVADLDGVDMTPCDIPKELLNLHDDEVARGLIADLRELRHNPAQNADAITEKEAALNARANEVATAMLTGERARYLEPRPRGIPLEDLPLDSDPAFHTLEVERATLKAISPIRNAAAISGTEGLLNDRACELAEDVKNEDLAAFPPRYEGILVKELKPHGDRLFSEAAEKRRSRKRNPSVTFKEDLEQIMSDRLGELAREQKDGDLYFLDPKPHGVALSDLPLATDSAFTKLREERHQLRESDPMSNRKAINELERLMNERVAEMALDVLRSDFDGIDSKPLSIQLDLLEPRRDATVASIIPELRRAKRVPQLKNKVAELKGKLNERVLELAGAALEQGRENYLDPEPEGVPLALLPLRTDEQFHGQEAQRATFRLEDAVKNAVAMEQLESQLNKRAHELAEGQRRSDLEGLDPAPRDIPLMLLEPHDDAKMAGFIKDLRVLKKDSVRNADKIKAQQRLMNNRAVELATAALDGERDYLDANPRGVPLSVLPLDTDPAFHKMEVARAVEKRAAHPDARAVSKLEDQLNARAEELAAAQLKRDLEGLETAPLGVPLTLLKPHQDSTFESMLPELRRLSKDPSTHAAKLKQLRAAANERNYELAEDFVAKDRATYIEAAPEGLARELLPLSSDEEFKELEAQKLRLQSAEADGHAADPREVAHLEERLRERAREVARQQLRKDRGYLDPFPEGVPLDVLPLDSDRVFRELEAKRAASKARNANTAAGELEDALNGRVHELARAQKQEDLRGLVQEPCGISLAALEPHSDARFAQLVDELRHLKASGGEGNKSAIAEVQQQMNERAREIAEAVTKNDRRYLHPKPENVPLQRVPLDTDPAFHAMEVERAMLKLADAKKNQHRIGDLEDQLNDRAHELARQVKALDYKGLSQAPRGIPIELLNLHNDPKFGSLLEERAHLGTTRGAETAAPIVRALNGRAEEAADRLLRGDRGYLDREPEGIALGRLPLDTDSVFNDLEVQRAVLKAKDPHRNASSISDLEDQLNARAHELANAVLASDRGYLDPQPQGVPLSELPLSADGKFHLMEVERAKLTARDPAANAARIAELEGRLNDRASDLAKKQLEEDLQGLDREPEGYPLKYLKPHHDAVFAAAVPALREAKAKVPHDPAKVREAQATLNARAHVMARERIAADRAKMDAEPEGVPLALLPLGEDAKFLQAEKEFRALEAAEKRKPAAAEEALAQMNERGHVLAKDYLQQSRGILDQEPEGLPLADVPLDSDESFCRLETARLRLLASGESPSSSEVQAMEDQLNDRAHELAKAEKTRARSFLRDTSSDIPKGLLSLDGDKAFVAKERDLRAALRSNDGASADLVPVLCRELQLRADEIGEAQLKGDRERYLDVQPAGVDLCDIPLDEDEAYHAMEVERATLRAADPRENKAAVGSLEKKLNERAHELARQIVASDRSYLPPEVYGIPVDELPLDTDSKFKKLERQRRAHKRSPAMRKEVLADEEELRTRANELANEVVAQDLDALKATYRGIPKEELGLHADEEFRELAKKRRRCRGKGRVEATQMAALEDDMDRRACEIADDVIENERAFLDAEPEGMYLADVPLDRDATFQQLEQEYRRRSKDPRTTKQNKEVLRELGEEMNRRSHTLAREEFARRREFMKQDPEGIPLWELGLDEDPEFKREEITRYRNEGSATPSEAVRAATAQRMDERAGELARTMLAADRAFLDPEPEGVPLELLPLDTDKSFSDLARERRRHKKALKNGAGEPEVKAVEERMNSRTHEMAKDFLEAERAFLSREPEGVPLDDLPLNSDAPFRAMERERLRLKREPAVKAGLIAAKEAELEDRAGVIARDLLRKERAFLDPEPLGVPLEELPLNHDPLLNQVERKRRTLRANPKRNHEGIRACEEQMAERVGEIATAFVEKQRSFLDQEPEDVPLRYLPLGTDRDFHEKEMLHRKLMQHPERNKAELAELEKKMNDRVHTLAKDLVLKGRAFLLPEPLGVPIADVPLNGDEEFRKMEEQRRALKEAGRNPGHIKAIEDRLNERAEMLAQKLLDGERAFMDPAPLGLSLSDIPLNSDARMRTIERTRRQLRKEDADRNAEDIAVLEGGMEGRAYELADELLANNRGYLHPEPFGVPLRDLPLHADADFHAMELQHFREKKRGKTELAALEKKLNERLMELAADFIKRDRAFLDQEPEGILLERLPLDADPVFHAMELERRQLRRGDENSRGVREMEHRMNLRVHELALEIRGWQDNEFHEANKHVAEAWPRVCELYPEGRYESFEPAAPTAGDVESAPQDAGYIVPFLAALSRHPVLLQRLIVTKEPPVNAPYTFVFFDPQSNPVYVDIDDRVPCTASGEPKFTRSPSRAWWPLLLEKAYAKFVGGYEQLDNCTPLETLRDLTGRPVTHTPFDMRLAEAASLGNGASVDFWRGVAEDLGRGDVVVCTSSDSAPDGVHPLSSYALLEVIVTLGGTTNPSDVVIKVENSYLHDEPHYSGPLCHGDINWNVELQQVCRYDAENTDVLYLPLPTFLRNFSSMQTCHINCGDRLTASGSWDSRTSGGNPKYTSFRENPIYLLQNSSSRPATVLVELRHDAPQFIDPDGLRHYPQSGIVLMEPTSTANPPTPLVTNSTARFLQKGVMLDSREVCSLMELPPSTTCWLIPYTSKAGQHGGFHLSVYPGFAKVSLTPMHFCGLSRNPTTATVTLAPGEEGRRVDFTVSAACEVHVLLRQEKVSDSRAASKGDVVADDDVVMVAFNDQAMKITSSGDATNAREHSLAFKADKPGYYSLLLTSPNPPVSGDCPCTVSIFTPKRTTVKFVAPPVGARPLQQTRFPTLPKNLKAPGNVSRRSRAPSTGRELQRGDSLPPLRNGSRSPGDRAAASKSTPASFRR